MTPAPDTQQPDVEAIREALVAAAGQWPATHGDKLAMYDVLVAALAAERQARQDAERERDMEHAKYQDAWAAAHRNAKQRASVEAALDDARRALVKVTQATNLAEAIGYARAALASLPGEPPPPSEARCICRYEERTRSAAGLRTFSRVPRPDCRIHGRAAGAPTE